MKLNYSISRLWPKMAAVVLACAGLASCGQDGLNPEGGEQLKPGEYPLDIVATLDEMQSRSETKDAWSDGDIIGVRIGTGEKGLYALNPDGTVQEMINALHWQNTTPATVKAWFPKDDRLDVSLADQSQGFYDIDYLYAEAQNQMYYSQVPLKFKHSMAKVQCNIIQGADITDEEFKTLTHNLYGFTKASWVEGVLTGKDYGKITSTSDHQALVVPQDMSGNEMFHISINVSINGKVVTKDYSYTPADGDLQAGTHYIYNITVKKDRIDVNPLIGKWEDVNDTPYPAQFATYKVNMPQDLPGIDRSTLEFESVDNADRYRSGEDDFLTVRGYTFKIIIPANDIERGKEFRMVGNSAEDKLLSAPQSVEELIEDVHEYVFYVRSDEVSLEYVDMPPRVGFILFEDGSWLCKPTPNKKPVGVIFKIGAGTGDNIAKNNEEWEDREINGYAVSLSDAGEYKWGPTGSVDITIDPNRPTSTSNTLTIYFGQLGVSNIAGTSSWTGYTLTEGVLNDKYFTGDYGYNSQGNFNYENKNPDKYDGTIFTGLLDYRASVPAASGSSGWYIPTVAQLKEINNNLEFINSCLKKIEGAEIETYAATTKAYWSVNPQNSLKKYDQAYCVKMQEKPKPEVYDSKNKEYTLRPILTF